MLKLIIKFSVEELIFFLTEERIPEDKTATKEELIWDYLQDQINEGSHGFSFIINGKDLFKKDSGYTNLHLLRKINNIFFDLLKTYEREPLNIVFDTSRRPSFVTVLRDYDKIVFFPTKDFSEVDETPIDINQVFEEVIRKVNEYKDIFWRAANILVPDDTFAFMNGVFGKEERYTQKRYDDPNFDWINYRTSGNTSKEEKKIAIYRFKSAEERVNYVKNIQKNSKNLDIIINDYYEWLPLETAWKNFKAEIFN